MNYLKKIGLTLCLLLCFACRKDIETTNLSLSIQIDELQTGKLYLMKEDGESSFTKVDSVIVDGENKHQINTNIKSPEMMFLVLDRKASNSIDNIIPFFAEAGKISIKTNLEHFSGDAIVLGSKNQDALQKFNHMIKKFNYKQIDLLKETVTQNKDSIKLSAEENRLRTKKALYTINYAFSIKNLEVAPYIVLNNSNYFTPKIIDSLYNSLSENAQKSIYGKKLKFK